MLRKYWLSLSFANLVLIRAWTDLIPLSPADEFLRKRLPGLGLYFGIAADVLLLSVLTFLVVLIAPRLPRWVQRVVPLIALVLLALSVRSVTTAAVQKIAVAVFAVLAGVSLRFPKPTVKVMGVLAMAAGPCLAVTFLLAPLELMTQKPLPPDPPLAKRLDGRPSVRVIWILFDDWDDRLTFDAREAGVRLPAIDDLTVRSFHGTRALAAQAGLAQLIDMSTYASVPSLLLGKRLRNAWAADAATQNLLFAAGNRTGVLTPDNTIFGEERKRGWNAAAVGWHLPSCRMLNAALVDCYWDERYTMGASASTAFPQSGIDEARMLFETTVLSPFGQALVAQRHFELYQALLARGKQFAGDGSLGLAFLHLNPPHVPYFYDPKIGRSLRYGVEGALYNDALGYVDRTLAEIEGSIRAAGLDDRTALIVSSDHPFRMAKVGDLHVPFIVHLPHDNVGAVYNGEFSAVVTKDLAIAIQTGEVKTSADVTRFVVAHSASY